MPERLSREHLLSDRLRHAVFPTLIAVGSLALLLALGAGLIDLIGLLDAIPAPVRWVGAPLATAVAAWRAAVHLRRLMAPDTSEGVEQVRHLARALRAALLGGSGAALLSGWLVDSDMLVGLALVVGLEELYETTMVLGLLELAARGERGELELPEWRIPGTRHAAR